MHSEDDSPRDEPARRYGEQAHVENHPLVSDFVPRRRLSVAAAALTLAGVAVGVEALVQIPAEASLGIPGIEPADLHASGQQLLSWLAVMAGMLGYAGCRLLSSLRRHRVDDRRGTYRVWRWAAVSCLLWPLAASTGLHRLAAQVGSAATGRTWMAGGREWWLIPAAILSGWIAWRLLAEVRESAGATVWFVTAVTCYVATLVAATGLLPADWTRWTVAVVRTAPLVGHACALASLALFARHVILDVQGLAPLARATRRPSKPRKPRRTSAAKSDATVEVDTASSTSTKPKLVAKTDAEPAKPAARKAARKATKPTPSKPAQALEPDAAETLAWDTPVDEDDGRPARRMSKAEKKRLRKEKQRRAA